MPDLVGDGVAEIVDVEVAVEADLPAHVGIETDEGLLNFGVRVVISVAPCDVGEGSSTRLGLRADEDVGLRTIRSLLKIDLGHALHMSNAARTSRTKSVRAM